MEKVIKKKDMSKYMSCPYCSKIVRYDGKHIDKCHDKFFKDLRGKIDREREEE